MSGVYIPIEIPENGKCITITVFDDGTVVRGGGSETFGKAIPAVDVQPVKHGRWSDPAEDMCLCTLCGWGFLFPYKTRAAYAELVHGFNYCPNCGAKMEGYDAQ